MKNLLKNPFKKGSEVTSTMQKKNKKKWDAYVCSDACLCLAPSFQNMLHRHDRKTTCRSYLSCGLQGLQDSAKYNGRAPKSSETSGSASGHSYGILNAVVQIHLYQHCQPIQREHMRTYPFNPIHSCNTAHKLWCLLPSSWLGAPMICGTEDHHGRFGKVKS